MLHNAFFEIIEQFLGDYSKEIYGRELIDKVSLSQKAIALTLERLEKEGILKSRKTGNIRFYSLNHRFSFIKDIVTIAEMMKKLRFFENEKKMEEIFRKADGIVGIFGSYAKGTSKKDSDVDVFMIGNKKAEEDYVSRGKTFDMEISIKYFEEKDFIELLKKGNKLVKEIILNHILVFNTEKFVNLIWENYYGYI